MRGLLIILVLVAFVSVEAQRKVKKDSDFVKWKNQFKKDKWEDKDSASLEKRAARVLEKKNRCKKHNEGKTATWVCGSNENDHLTSEEEESRLKGLRPPVEARALPRAPVFNSFSPATLPVTVDWTSKCPPVYNQGRCGSCWAFAAITTLECYNRIKNLPFTTLSPQFLIDCDITSSNKQCNGGWPRVAFDNLITRFGTSCSRLADYPYLSANYNATYTGYSTCKSTLRRYPLNYTSTYQVNVNGNEATLKYLIANYGPVSIGMWASSAFMSYRSGVFSDPLCPVKTATVPQCDFKNVNHAMVIIGYTTLNGVPVWIVRNSWGSTWGTAGNVYMRRDATNNCNPACFAMFVD